MEHLKLEVFDLPTTETPNPTGSQYAALEEDASITITDTSEIFSSGDVWSHSFTLNVFANVHIFGTAGDLHGSRLHEQVNKRKARLWLDGLPLYLGYLKLDDEAEVDSEGNVDVTFESGQKTFEALIEGGKANQVPMFSDVRFGVALWRKRWTAVELRLSAYAKYTDDKISGSTDVTHVVDMTDVAETKDEKITPFQSDGEYVSVQEYPRMVFPKGIFSPVTQGASSSVDCLNTDNPYTEDENGTPTVPYCNVALCYQKQGYEKKNERGDYEPDYSSEPEAQRGYEYMPANRVNSAPNFFVIYWIRSLMKHLGIHVDENQMMDVEDLRRLFFVNTKCEYVKPKYIRSGTIDPRFARYKFINSYYRLVPEWLDWDGVAEKAYFSYQKKITKVKECGFEAVAYDKSAPHFDTSDLTDWEIRQVEARLENLDIKKLYINVNQVEDLPKRAMDRYLDANDWLHDAIASSECFPNTDISEVIKALENGFGIRFLFSDSYKRVRIVLLRNLFRSTEVQDIQCEIVDEDQKVENNVRGFRLTYGKGNEDSHFYYKGFADMLPHKKELWVDNSDEHDYSQWNLNATYAEILKRVTAFNKVCYVTPNTGNAWGVKVDKDAKRYLDQHPSLFEYAGYMDAEDGDCTGEEETIEEINVGFTPAIMNDLNMEAEQGTDERDPVEEQKFALFVDEQMRPRRPSMTPDAEQQSESNFHYKVGAANDKKGTMYDKYGPGGNPQMTHDDGIVAPGEFCIASDMMATKNQLKATIHRTINIPSSGGGDNKDVDVMWDFDELTIDGYINEGYRLYLEDNYEPNDDGIPPIDTHDWGLTLGIMRGSGSDSYVAVKGDADDNEGNESWYLQTGSSVTSHPDMCDAFGHEWDYNGEEPGIGADGRLSLKLRAEKPNPYFDPKQPESENNKRYLEITNQDLKRRGLADTMYSEYSYWKRNARILRRQVHMTLAQYLTIDKTVRVRVGDVMGFILKMQFTASNKTGMGAVTMEIMYI